MLYRLGPYQVEDKIEPAKQALLRQIRVTRAPLVNTDAQDDNSLTLRWQANAAANFEPGESDLKSGGSVVWKETEGLTVRVSGDGIRLETPVNESGPVRRWIDLNPPCTFNVEYQW